MHSLIRNFSLLGLLCLSTFLQAQNLSITYVNPSSFTVCDTANFEVTIANTLQDSLFSATLTATLPPGVEYSVGSVSNATESNTSDLNAPVFSLLVLPPGETVTVTFSIQSRCALVDDINNGSLFSNTYAVTHSTGNTFITTTPYIIETALLQIVSLNDQMMSGVTGQILTRTWTLTNTRLGALSNLTFTDTYGAGVTITSPMGDVITQLPGVLQIELGGADFANFGDGDELFELNEQITITENIEITGCGDPPVSTSFLTASWGCSGETCQQVNTTAVVTIAANGTMPNIVSTIIDPIPLDFCASEGNPAGISLFNNGSAAAMDVIVNISHFKSGSIGLRNSSLTITNAGTPVDAVVNFFDPVNFDACITPGSLSDSIVVTIPEILPGETILLEWENFICAVGCGDEPPSWKYDFYHENDCPPGSFGSGGHVSGDANTGDLVSQFVTYYLGNFLENNGIYTLTYTLKSPLIVDSSGVLQVDINLPCGLSWGNNDNFNLDGQFPDSVQILPQMPGGEAVSLFFELPFIIDTVASDFNVVFECDSNCFDIPDCIVEFVTSCDVPPATGTIDDINVEVTTTVLINNSTCGPEDCEDFDLTYYCAASTDEICPDTIIGYFTSTQEFHRENLGLPDNNNDRFADAAGDIDLNAIRRDRALTGDTLHTKVDATMVIDIPGESLPNAALVINFESHTIDHGWDGGQFMDTISQLELVNDNTGFQDIGGTITIVDISTGDIFQCDLPIPRVNNEQRGKISIVNTRPEDILDFWMYVSYIYDITPAFLAEQGCDIPPGWEFEDGDIIEANAYHRAMYNSSPPVVLNMRTVSGLFASNPPGPLQENDFNCGADGQRWQLSGYRYQVSPGLYEMPPCASSNEPGNTFVWFTLGLANFFPFEFRSFMHLDNWDYTLPANAVLLNSEVASLTINGGPTVLSNTPLDWTQNGLTYDFDISDIPLATLDEGYQLVLNHEFELPCYVDEPQPIEIDATLDFAPSLLETDPLDTTILGSASIFPVRPNMQFIPVNVNHESTSNQAIWEFNMTNFSPFNQEALNAWLSVYSPSGQLTDFQLINLSTGQSIPLANGLFQLGDLPDDWSNEFQLVANIQNCQPDLLEITFGWNCEAYTDLMDPVCFEETEVLTLTALLGELEMLVESPESPFLLCDTMEYHTVELFNAQFGAVFDIELLAALPEGLIIMPGTSELEYPTGSGFQPIGDPVLTSMDTALYDLSSLNVLLGDQGLLGFDQNPNNSVRIRFKTATECGFISPSQIIFNATGKQGCGVDANELSKPAEELFIEGVTPLYDANITIETNVPPTLSCGDSINITVTLEADAVTAGTDSVFVYIPSGLAYQPGTYVPGPNASSDPPIIDFVEDQFVLKWPLVTGIPAFTNISFDATFAAVAGGECDSTVLEIVTYQLQQAECIANGDLCSILAETGRKDLEVVFTIASLGLDQLNLLVEAGEANYNVLLENNGNASPDDVFVEFYNDIDNSGTLTPGDNLIHTHTHSGGLGAGEAVTINGSFPAFYSILCNIIVVVTNEANCTCTEDVIPGLEVVPAIGPVDSTCLGNLIQLGYGLPDLSDHTHEWTPSTGLDCDDCPNPILNTDELNLSSTPATVDFTSFDTYPNGCILESLFSVLIVEGGSESEEIVEACANDLVTLEGPDGANSYNWQGPGVVDSTLQNQLFVLEDTTSYTLIWEDNFDCRNLVDFQINIPEAYKIDTLGLCEGSSITIDGITYFDEFEFCDTFLQNNCEVVRCQFYEVRDTPVVQFPLDTLCFLEGTEITVDQLSGDFDSYEWSPSGPLSCDNCPDPTLEVINETFVITVGDDQTQCRATTQLTVVAISPCSQESILVPNVFTPNSDGTNDRFGPVVTPGTEKLITEAKIRVWDRWGTKVYEGEGLSQIHWDGLFKGKKAASDVYVYMMELACQEEAVTIKGDVTLLR